MTKILKLFLKRQCEAGLALADSSDLLNLNPLGEAPHQRYVASFGSRGLIQEDGDIVEAQNFHVGIQFPLDYLDRVRPFEVLMCLGPMNVFHPNINGPLLCVGHIAPGTGLVDLLYQCYEVLGYSKVTMDERDALNDEACRWARQNQNRFPVENRPLKRRSRVLEVEARDQ